MLREYGLAYRLGSRTQHTGSETIYDESSYLGGDMRTPIIVRTAIANGVSFPDAKLVIIGANDLSDDADVAARPLPARSKSKTAAFVSDFRDLTVGDYVVHVEHGIGRYHGLKEIQQDGLNVEFMVLEFAEQRAPLRPAHAARPDPEVPLHRRRSRAGAEQAGRPAVGQDQGAREEGHGRTWPTSC